MQHKYTDDFPLHKLISIVQTSLDRRQLTRATDRVLQTFYASLGTLRRTASQSVRYTLTENAFRIYSTSSRQASSVSVAELRRDKTLFFTENTRATLSDVQVEVFDEVTEEGGGFRTIRIDNAFDFKCPLNCAIADADPEKRFINGLRSRETLEHIDAWIKSTTMKFYEIDYSVKIGNHTRYGKFNPDFFIKAGDLVLVVEIKDDDEVQDPSEENRKKNEAALLHFDAVNARLAKDGSPIHYQFNFVTPSSIGTYFQYLREGKIAAFKSTLDLELVKKV